MGTPEAPDRRELRSTIFALAFVIGLHEAIFAAAWALRGVVVSVWEKGPLVDPASPYAPENALIFSVVGGIVAVDLYLALSFWLARRATGRAGRLLAVVVAVVVAGIGAEGAVRAAAALRMPTWYRPHPTLHWVVRANLQDYAYGTDGTLLTTNEDGLREAKVGREKPAGETRILVLGDSSNFGQGVSGAELWTTQLEGLLQPRFEAAGRGPVRVINAATPGWTTFQGLEVLRGLGGEYSPDLVIAGFNNDSGPELQTDASRALMGWPALNGALWRSELYLLMRTGVLSAVRALHPEAQAIYAARGAGEKPTYGALPAERRARLTQRVPQAQSLENLRAMQALGRERGFSLVWLNMPINRALPDLVERYVDYGDRAAIFAMAEAESLPLIDIDGRWLRSREADLHIVGHVFHPNATGHRRLSEQVADALLQRGLIPGQPALSAAPIDIGGPPPAPDEQTARLGISTLTPVHAHVLAVLEDHPELIAQHGLSLQLQGYARGGPQGEDVARGALDAWFSCELPAIEMARSRPDAAIVASPGSLGRIAVVGAAQSLDGLRGAAVGLSAGSTPALDWARWGAGLGASVRDTPTDQLFSSLENNEVQAIVGWDPWVAQWTADPRFSVVEARAFQSVLAVGGHWAIGDRSALRPAGEGEVPRAARLVALIEAALRLAAADRARYDAKVAEMSGWPIEIVREVGDQNALLAGQATSMAPAADAVPGLDRARAHLGLPSAVGALQPEVLSGAPPSGLGGAGGPMPPGGAKGPPPGGMKGPPPGGMKGPPPGGRKGPPPTPR